MPWLHLRARRLVIEALQGNRHPFYAAKRNDRIRSPSHVGGACADENNDKATRWMCVRANCTAEALVFRSSSITVGTRRVPSNSYKRSACTAGQCKNTSRKHTMAYLQTLPLPWHTFVACWYLRFASLHQLMGT